jgi:transcriptional regulator with XRE-family HTH domain
MEFPEKLDRLIAQRRMSQSELSRLTGIAQSTISDMTKGKRWPSMKQAWALAVALNASLDYLANDALDDPPKANTLREDERSVLKFYHVLGLTEDEAVGAMTAALNARHRPIEVQSVEPPDSAADIEALAVRMLAKAKLLARMTHEASESALKPIHDDGPRFTEDQLKPKKAAKKS